MRVATGLAIIFATPLWAQMPQPGGPVARWLLQWLRTTMVAI